MPGDEGSAQKNRYNSGIRSLSSPGKGFPAWSPAATALADDVEEGLALFDIDGVESAGERCRQFRRVLDPLAVAAGGSADLLERRQFLEVDKGRPVAARRLALRVQAQSGATHRAPHRIVDDDKQHWQPVHG